MKYYKFYNNYTEVMSHVLNLGFYFSGYDWLDYSKHINGYIIVNGNHAKIIDHNILTLG